MSTTITPDDIMAISMKIAEDYIRDTDYEFADINRQMDAAERLTHEAIAEGNVEKATKYLMLHMDLLMKYMEKVEEVRDPKRMFNYTMAKLFK